MRDLDLALGKNLPIALPAEPHPRLSAREA